MSARGMMHSVTPPAPPRQPLPHRPRMRPQTTRDRRQAPAHRHRDEHTRRPALKPVEMHARSVVDPNLLACLLVSVQSSHPTV